MDVTNFFILDNFDSQIIKTYIYHFPIEEVYKAYTDKDLLLKLCQYKITIINSTKDNIFEVEGNEITILINGKTVILRIKKVIKSKTFYQIKAETIQLPLDYVPFSIGFELLWDSTKEITVFNGQINLAKSSLQESILSTFKQTKFFPTEEIDNYLKNKVKNLEQDESILINVSIIKFWEFITDLKNIEYFLNMPDTEITRESNNIIKVTDNKNNNIIRLIERQTKIDEANYTLFLESFDSLLQMPLQSMQIQLVKVNDNATLIIFKHKILEYIPYDALRSNSSCKQKILKKIKKILEK